MFIYLRSSWTEEIGQFAAVFVSAPLCDGPLRTDRGGQGLWDGGHVVYGQVDSPTTPQTSHLQDRVLHSHKQEPYTT